MSLFTPLYDRAIGWARHRRAPAYLAGLSFAESTFFPVPPDVMLIPMAVAAPQRAWRLAALTTAASVIGGVFGYLIGAFAFELVLPWLQNSAYVHGFTAAQEAFERYGFWFILVAGFSPIPYKVFTIASGVVGMPVLPFILGSLVGRGGRFFLEAALVRLGGPEIATRIRHHVEWLGWLTVAALAIAGALLALR